MPGKDADTVEEWLLIVENGPNGKSVEINANDEKAEFRIGRQDNVVRTARKKPCEFLRLLAKNRGKTVAKSKCLSEYAPGYPHGIEYATGPKGILTSAKADIIETLEELFPSSSDFDWRDYIKMDKGSGYRLSTSPEPDARAREARGARNAGSAQAARPQAPAGDTPMRAQGCLEQPQRSPQVPRPPAGAASEPGVATPGRPFTLHVLYSALHEGRGFQRWAGLEEPWAPLAGPAPKDDDPAAFLKRLFGAEFASRYLPQLEAAYTATSTDTDLSECFCALVQPGGFYMSRMCAAAEALVQSRGIPYDGLLHLGEVAYAATQDKRLAPARLAACGRFGEAPSKLLAGFALVALFHDDPNGRFAAVFDKLGGL